MADFTMTGMDRLSASELQELLEVEGFGDKINVREPDTKIGQAGSLDSVAAILSDPNSVTLLLLTAWIVSKKSFAIEIKWRGKILKINYQQDGPIAVLKELKGFFKS